MTVAATELLDGPLYFLGRLHPHSGSGVGGSVTDVALLRAEGGKAALLFSSEEVARRHLPTLPAGTVVQAVTDHRAKEELFRAALGRGARELWFDTEIGREPLVRYPLARALDYVLSFKRASACL